ncbi:MULTISPECIES: ABC transporter ATP-binding protein [unclassified Chelatococcus]|uniref:ABC transporter ATP-binding protein n=1 Tax=unclassified Chelatococcus TaxID=2638111 RepID=UPI0002E826FA|nr:MULTISPECIES: ATP-binding cassette domain-containing protein [unclassified Chelatococcus]ALA20200.1 ABC transporter ATP-binding protein [Chelatococcus sp. CO-6]
MLELADISVSIAGTPVLRRVAFRVREGETVAFVGRNGAGKTTTLRALMGLIDYSGSIRLDGRAIDPVPAHERPGLGIGYAPEDRRLFSAFSIVENILLPARVARLSAAETKRRLDRVYAILPELAQLAERPAGSVSGGQGKMAALGRALMLGTRLVLLDEPFQGLAPVLANRYAEALRALRDADRTLSLIITESNPALLKHFAERTITIERGEIDRRAAA